MCKTDKKDNKKCAVILAGGKGTRLRPYTITMPKPLVPVGDYPILEIIIRRLAHEGFGKVIMTVNHLADLLMSYFGDGSKWGIEIEYSLETKPLGTMGPLKLLNDLPDNFLVMNGDILTDLKFGEFFENHVAGDSLFTISGFERKHRVDYGVLHVDDNSHLNGFEEKPELDYTVSMGIYAMSKECLNYIPEDTYFGFDTLMLKLIEDKKNVSVKKWDGYWLDIGRPDDYQIATEKFEENKEQFL